MHGSPRRSLSVQATSSAWDFGAECDRRWFTPSPELSLHALSRLLVVSEMAKSREYRERILNVEHGDFNPLVFTTLVQWASAASWKRISERQGRRLSFALLRTTLLCVRGTRKSI